MSASPLSPADRAKDAAARAALGEVRDGMKLGLGTGSTAAFLVAALGERVKAEGLRLTAVPTSRRTAELAAAVGIQTVTLDAAGRLDLTIDGADELDDRLQLIKGGGAALLHEKIVATASDRMIVIADDSKHVARLGAFPLPVEVIPFGWESSARLVRKALDELGYEGRDVVLRGADAPIRTDEGNLILDLHLGAISDAQALSDRLLAVAGVVETGLFLNIASRAILGSADGSTREVLA
ncbi:ribose-5-phosphate isomerase RpiA [Paracoccus sp. p4-l81]|uniref:ribose-5-phosphate isomerase RpiA n=1 Tax=unclassified Paracoccus (in: a-proteobacteria) TaxID=2688777 RepID=UPI0035B77A89